MSIFKIVDIDKRYVIFFLEIRLFSIKHSHQLTFPEVKELGISSALSSPRIVVSLTSYPARMNTLYPMLCTVFNQTLKPNAIILWLAEEQFPNKENDLPDDILKLRDFGLTIRWCEDTRSYKKLIPALMEYPNDIIITLDDDTCYARDTIESLYSSYKKYPNDVHAHRCGRVKIVNGRLQNIPTCYLYDKDFHQASYFNRLIGHAGVLYPPHVFFRDIKKKEIFQEILPTHDDVYFWAMLVLNRVKTRVVKGFSESVYSIDGSQSSGLCKINRSKSSGLSIEEAYARIERRYPEILKIMNEEVGGH